MMLVAICTLRGTCEGSDGNEAHATGNCRKVGRKLGYNVLLLDGK
jgi:hypothetical protein